MQVPRTADGSVSMSSDGRTRHVEPVWAPDDDQGSPSQRMLVPPDAQIRRLVKCMCRYDEKLACTNLSDALAHFDDLDALFPTEELRGVSCIDGVDAKWRLCSGCSPSGERHGELGVISLPSRVEWPKHHDHAAPRPHHMNGEGRELGVFTDTIEVAALQRVR